MEPTAAQLAARIAGAGLSPAQAAGVKAGTGYTPSDPSLSYYKPSGGGVAPAVSSSAPAPAPAPKPAPAPSPAAPTTYKVTTKSGTDLYYNPTTGQYSSDSGGGTPVNYDSESGAVTNADGTPYNPDATQSAENANIQNTEASVLHPTPPESEDQIYQRLLGESSGLLDTIQKEFDSAIASITANDTAAGNVAAQNENAMAAASGLLGSSAAAGQAAKTAQTTATKTNADVAQVQQARASAVAGYLQTIMSAASQESEFEQGQFRTDQANALTLAAQKKADGQTAVQNMAKTGVNFDTLSTDPKYAQTYQNMLGLYNGDPNLLKAAWIAAAQTSTTSQYLSQQPIQTADGKWVFLKQVTNPDGTTSIQPEALDLSKYLSQGQSLTTLNGQPYAVTQNPDGTFTYTPIIKSGANAGTLGSVTPPSGVDTAIGTVPAGQNPDPSAVVPKTNLTQGAIDNLVQEYNTTGKMPSVGLGNTMARWAIYNRAAQLNPSGLGVVATQSYYKALQTGINRAQSLLAPTQAAANKASAQIDIVRNLGNKVKFGSNVVYNKATLAYETKGTSDPDITTFVSAMNTLVNEYGKVTSGNVGAGGLTDAARSQAYDTVNASMSNETLNQVLDLMQSEMTNTVSGYQDVISGSLSQIQGGSSPDSSGSGAGSAPISVTESTDNSVNFSDGSTIVQDANGNWVVK